MYNKYITYRKEMSMELLPIGLSIELITKILVEIVGLFWLIRNM